MENTINLLAMFGGRVLEFWLRVLSIFVNVRKYQQINILGHFQM